MTTPANTKERLLAPLRDLLWTAWDGIILILGATLRLAMWGGLALVILVGGNLLERLIIDAVTESGSRFSQSADAVGDAMIVTGALVSTAIGVVQVGIYSWRDLQRTLNE